MKNDSGRPRKVRSHGPGGRKPKCGLCTWGRKDQRLKRAKQKVRREAEGAS